MSTKLNFTYSEKLFEEAKQLCPGGVLGIRKPGNFIPGEYPMFIEKAEDMHLYDVDGNRFIDLLASYGPIIIGHKEKEIDDAVIKKIKEDGFCFNLAQKHQNELIKLLIKHIPCAEMGFLVKTGSDAASSAIRISRAYTDRDMVLRCGYHGWHDWCIAVKNGIPENCYRDVDSFEYNNIDSLKAKIKEHSGKVGTIIMTPVCHDLNAPIIEPKDDFLNKVKEIAKENNIVLIFDEIRTGFRMSMGGAQEYYGVTPDMAIVGKAMANGYPISAVVGKKEVMDAMEDKHVFISSTFFPNSLEMVASIATINMLERENVIENIRKKGEKVKNSILESIEVTGVKAIYSGILPMPFVTFYKDDKDNDPKAYRNRRNLFYTELIRRGVFMQPFHHGYIAFRHSDADIDKVCGAIRESMEEVIKNIP